MANDFDEAALRKHLNYPVDAIYCDIKYHFIEGARYQHSLMQERLAEAERYWKLENIEHGKVVGVLQSRIAELKAELARVPGEIQMYRQKFESMVSSHDHAQLSATCERMRLALEFALKNYENTHGINCVILQYEIDECSCGANEWHESARKAIESGERGECDGV